MKHRSKVIIIILVLIISCQSDNDSENDLIGDWSLEKVFEYEGDVTDKHNPKKNRWIRFNSDGSFVSDGDPHGRNTGRWSLEDGVLFIDSDVEGDDSSWKVIIESERMTFTGIGHPRQENTKLIHIRKKD